jgi:hypothetical protein
MEIEIPGIPIWGNGLFKALKNKNKISLIYTYPNCGGTVIKRINNNDSNNKLLKNIPVQFEIENLTSKINFSNEIDFYLSEYCAKWEYKPILFTDSFKTPNFYDDPTLHNPDAIFVYQDYNYRFCNIDREHFKEPWKLVMLPGQNLKNTQRSATLIFIHSNDTLSAIVTKRILPKRLKL